MLGGEGLHLHSGHLLYLLQREQTGSRFHHSCQAFQRTGGGIDRELELLGQHPQAGHMVGMIVGDEDTAQAGGIDAGIAQLRADAAGGDACINEQATLAFAGGKVVAIAAAAAGKRIKCYHAVTSGEWVG